MAYYEGAAQVEQVIDNLALQYPLAAHKIALPNPTHERRISSALLLSTQPQSGKDTVLILGGVHGNEWGSCEIALNLATLLLRAHDQQAGLGFGGTPDASNVLQGGARFSKAQIQDLLLNRDVMILPLVNPDGREFTHHAATSSEAAWRKNRREFFAGGQRVGIGVDINRNFDFAFDLGLYHPGSSPAASVDLPTSTYQGPEANSEAETRNVVWLMDQLPHLGWMVDLHSAGLSFCHSWNHDEIQSGNPAMNFRSSIAHGKMGTSGASTYQEFLAASDLSDLQALAKRFASEAFAVRHTVFTTGPAFFGNSPFPGTSHDYAYSRHLVDSGKSKVLAFACEWGDLNPLPEWEQMEGIVEEVTAGLIGFCLQTIPIPLSG